MFNIEYMKWSVRQRVIRILILDLELALLSLFTTYFFVFLSVFFSSILEGQGNWGKCPRSYTHCLSACMSGVFTHLCERAFLCSTVLHWTITSQKEPPTKQSCCAVPRLVTFNRPLIVVSWKRLRSMSDCLEDQINSNWGPYRSLSNHQ